MIGRLHSKALKCQVFGRSLTDDNCLNLCRTFETSDEALQVLLPERGGRRCVDPCGLPFRLLRCCDDLPDVQVKFRPSF